MKTQINIIKETSVKKPLFGTDIEIISYDLMLGKKKEEILEILEESYNYALTLQKIFNFFDEESELSILNKERKIVASPELLEVIKKALKFSKETGGRYDISLGKSILERKKGKNIENIESNYNSIKIVKNIVELKKKDFLIDLGSIAKGYIADKISQFLKARGLREFMIDARGDIIVSGDFEHVIEIQHPRDKEKSIGKIKLKNQSVATSGDYNQFYGAFSNSHIINSTDLISVSVVADSLTEADALSTAIFVSKEKDRKKLINNNKNNKVLNLDNNMNIEKYNGFEEIIVK